MVPFVVLSGCSGGGKSALLTALEGRGYAVVREPGRRIVQDEIAQNGNALPWIDLPAFAQRAIAMAKDDLDAAPVDRGWVFFDRGLVDAAAALEYATGAPALAQMTGDKPYWKKVFLVPPWPEIFVSDAERAHGFEDAVAEYERLLRAYSDLGYEIALVPKTSVEARAEFILSQLEHSDQ